MFKKHLIILLLLCAGIVLKSGAQEREIILHPELGTPKWIEFNHSKPLLSNWFPVLSKLSGQSERISWNIYSHLTDELGQKHHRLHQYYNGIEVELGTGILHSTGPFLESFNGELIPEHLFSGRKLLSEERARSIALEKVNALKYYWQDPAQNTILADLTQNPDTSWFPYAKLVYCPADLQITGMHRLAFKFSIYALEPLSGQMVFVDAETGELLAVSPLIIHTDVKGTAVTRYNGTRTIDTDSTAPYNYRLREKVRGKGVETLNLKNGTSYAAAVDFTDSNNYWNNFNAKQDEIATDAHWGAEKTYDFFDTLLGRKSFDNNNAKILSYVHYSNNYANAFWNGAYMTYGDGNGSTWKPLTSVDVCGHEISHAVTTYSANLIYSYESGALNESFSDIFGNAIERWARPSKYNWKVGEDFTTSGNGIRDMANPNAYNHPKYYKGNKWYTGTADNGGVHSNSGVQNYWFYLITEGVKGTNEKNEVFDIDSLGLVDAARIAYRNLTVYLTKNSSYNDARVFAIKSAADLFGPCSRQVIAVTNAWWACGVGAKYDSAFARADFKGDTMACGKNDTVSFTNMSTNYKACIWKFGDGNTSSLVNPKHVYHQYGVFTVSLKVNSCFKGNRDSITRINYIKIDSTFDICDAAVMPFTGSDSVYKCKGFVYDDGGEGTYGALKQVNLKVLMPGSDSVRIRFLELDYENGYDSVVIFKNNTAQSNKIGRFTGKVLPFGGNWITVQAGSLWFRQYSDPLVEGKGFKIAFESFRPPLTLDLGKDTILCSGDSVLISPSVSGGYAPDYLYRWNNGQITSTVFAKPRQSGYLKLLLLDACTGKQVEDSIYITVRTGLKAVLPPDTTLCVGNGILLKVQASGGLQGNYKFSWNQGLGNQDNHWVNPVVSTTYRVILSDGCTAKSDTAEMNVHVRTPLQLKLSSNGLQHCIGKSIQLQANPSGGDTTGHAVTWNQGLGSGKNKTTTLVDTTLYVAVLTDGCTVKPARDSILLVTYPPLFVNLQGDTTLCRGSMLTLRPKTGGGKGSGYVFNWRTGQTTQNITVQPVQKTAYRLTLSDGCSPDASDSMVADLFAPLQLSLQRDTTLCDGQSLGLALQGTGGNPGTRQITWNPGGISGFNPVLSPSTGSTFYQAVLSDGCTTISDTTSFTITRLPPLAAAITLTPAAICPGQTVKIDITLSGGKSAMHQWKLNGNAIFYLSQSFVPGAGGIYTLDLSDGCSVPASAAAALTMHALPQATIQADKKLLCAGESVQLQYNSPDASALTWYFGPSDSLQTLSTPIQKSFANAGRYAVKTKITTSNSCTGWFHLTDTLTVVNYPVAGFEVVPDEVTFENPTVKIKDLSSGAAQYQWAMGDGQWLTTPGDFKYTYPADTGRYRLMQIVQVPPGCSDTVYRWLHVKDVYRLHIPNAFSPDGDGLNEVFAPYAGGVLEVNLKIFNRWGELLFESNKLQEGWNGTDPQGTACQPGMYVYYITTLDLEGARHARKGTVLLLR